MTDSNNLLRAVTQPEDDAAREARHQILATLLGAYVDRELPPETASQIDAHLLGCGRCRNELHVQTAVRDRLSRSTVPTATSVLQDRIRAAIAVTPVPVVVEAPAPAGRALAGASQRRWGWIASAVVAMVVLGGAIASLRTHEPQLDPPPLVGAASMPIVREVLDDYRRVSQGDLPGRARDIEAVRSAVAFPVVPITNADAHLLGAWTTDLAGEPAAVLAYRWKTTVVLQYVVAEPTLFRVRDFRAAFAAHQAVVTQSGSQGLLSWPEADAGSLLVGDLPWQELVRLGRAQVR
jgi:anti-sigma factor RsiW